MSAGALRMEKASSLRSASPPRTPQPRGAALKTTRAALFTPAVREVMDIRQAASYLGISADSLYRYAAESQVPAFRLGNRWRFKKSLLDHWMEEQSEPDPRAKAVKSQRKKPVGSAR